MGVPTNHTQVMDDHDFSRYNLSFWLSPTLRTHHLENIQEGDKDETEHPLIFPKDKQ